MQNTLVRFNQWYDGLAPTPRFLYFIAAMALAVFPLRLGIAAGNAGVAITGGILFLSMAVVGVHRAFSLGGRVHRAMGIAMIVGIAVILAALVSLLLRV